MAKPSKRLHPAPVMKKQMIQERIYRGDILNVSSTQKSMQQHFSLSQKYSTELRPQEPRQFLWELKEVTKIGRGASASPTLLNWILSRRNKITWTRARICNYLFMKVEKKRENKSDEYKKNFLKIRYTNEMNKTEKNNRYYFTFLWSGKYKPT